MRTAKSAARSHAPGCGGKCAADDVGQADNSRASDGDQRNVANGRERFYAASVAAALRRDFRSGLLRLEAIANPHGNAGSVTRAQRLRMQHFRAEISELCGLAIGNFGNGAASGTSRGSAVRTPSTSVQMITSSASSARAQNRGGIIRAATAECGQHSFPGRADKSGNHRDNVLVAAAGEGALRSVRVWAP